MHPSAKAVGGKIPPLDRSRIGAAPLTAAARTPMSLRVRIQSSETARAATPAASDEYPSPLGAGNLVSVSSAPLQVTRTRSSTRSPLSNGDHHGLCELQRHPRCRLKRAQLRLEHHVQEWKHVHLLRCACVEVCGPDLGIVRWPVLQREHPRSALLEPRLTPAGADLLRCGSAPTSRASAGESTDYTESLERARRKCGRVSAWRIA